MPRQSELTEPIFQSSRFAIRIASTNDVPELADIIADSFHPKTGWWQWLYPLSRMGIYEDLRQRLHSHSPHYICFVAVANAGTSGHPWAPSSSSALGTIEMALRPHSWYANTSALPYLSNLAVRDRHRGQGIAQKLLLACERTALSWGFKDLYLHVLENNYPAQRVYAKLDYRVSKVELGFSSRLFGQPRRMLLHKQFPQPDRPVGVR